MRLLVIDNYDSFTFNLVQLFYEFDVGVDVYRNDEINLYQIRKINPDWICISPGPGIPAQSGISSRVIRQFGKEIPILGVCLGMQVINEVFGGKTVKAPVPVHGKCDIVYHSQDSIFDSLPSPFKVARYHSLAIQTGSSKIRKLAFTEDGVVMGIRHAHYPIYGVQFHPESFMSEYGDRLISNFLKSRTMVANEAIEEDYNVSEQLAMSTSISA